MSKKHVTEMDPEGSYAKDNLEAVNGYMEIDLENGSLWVNTPHGLIAIHIGFGGFHKITSWLPHEIKIKKETERGQMQITRLEPTFNSISAFRREASK